MHGHCARPARSQLPSSHLHRGCGWQLLCRCLTPQLWSPRARAQDRVLTRNWGPFQSSPLFSDPSPSLFFGFFSLRTFSPMLVIYFLYLLSQTVISCGRDHWVSQENTYPGPVLSGRPVRTAADRGDLGVPVSSSALCSRL